MKLNLSDSQITQMHHLYTKEMLSGRDICTRMNIPVHRFFILSRENHWFEERQSNRKALGLPPDPDKRTDRIHNSLTEPQIKNLHDLYVHQQLPVPEILKRTGTNRSVFYRYVRKYDWPSERRSTRTQLSLTPEPDTRNKHINWVMARYVYISSDCSLYAISRMLGVDPRLVKRYAKQHDWQEARRKHRIRVLSLLHTHPVS